MQQKFFIIAGEKSGDYLGAKLIKAIKKINKDAEFFGVGGEEMEKCGMSSLFPLSQISLMGVFEILPKIFQIKKLINNTAEFCKETNPDYIITIDSPGFNFRVMEKLISLKCQKIHYVSPSVWAYKPSRVFKIEKLYHKVLCLLPFEPVYYIQAKIIAKFVGHPIIEDVKNSKISKTEFLNKFGLNKNTKILTLISGSRKAEVEKMMPIFIEALDKFSAHQDFAIFMPVISEEHKAQCSFYCRNLSIKFFFVDQDNKAELYSHTDFALVKSGTSSLELALYKIPMIVAYKVNLLTALILKYYYKFNSHVSIVNILLGKEVIPEYLQNNCTSEKILEGLMKFSDKNFCINQKQEFELVAKKLVCPKLSKPSEAAAFIIMDRAI